MKQNVLITLLCLVVCAAGIFHIVQVSKNAGSITSTAPRALGSGKAPSALPEKNVGPTARLYDYECDGHVAFEVSFAPNMSALHIAPKDPKATFPPKGVLLKQPTTSGAQYENKDLVFRGNSDGVVLTTGDQALHCSPVTKANEPAMNFGN